MNKRKLKLLSGLSIFVLFSTLIFSACASKTTTVEEILAEPLPENTENIPEIEFQTFVDEISASRDQIAANEELYVAYINMGNAYRSLGQLEKAYVIYDHLSQQYPTGDAAWLNRSVALEDMERYEEALESYKMVIANTSSFEEGYFRSGLIMINKLKSPDSQIRAHFEEAIVATQYDDLITTTYLIYLHDQGDNKHLDEVLQKALESDPENPRFLEIQESYDNL